MDDAAASTSAIKNSSGTSHNASVEEMNPVCGYWLANQSAIKNLAIAHVVIEASAAPSRAATTPSAKNGSWIIVLEAPTRRMIPVSRRREKAESRMVVAISKMAVMSMMTAKAMAITDAIFIKEKSDSKSSRWSETTSTPAIPENISLTTSYCSGSTSETLNDSGSWSAVTLSAISRLAYCCWNNSRACS